LKFINEHIPETYDGDRTTEAIVKYSKLKSGPPHEEVACKDIATEVEPENLSLVYFGATEGALWEHFVTVSKDKKTHGHFKFFHT